MVLSLITLAIIAIGLWVVWLARRWRSYRSEKALIASWTPEFLDISAAVFVLEGLATSDPSQLLDEAKSLHVLTLQHRAKHLYEAIIEASRDGRLKILGYQMQYPMARLSECRRITGAIRDHRLTTLNW
jgi:hypothetical protein